MSSNDRKNTSSLLRNCSHRQLFNATRSWADPEGRQGVRTPPPPEKHTNIGFLSNTGQDPLKKITKLLSQHSMLGRYRPASMAFRWRADDGPLLVLLDPLCPLQNKTLSELDLLWQNFLDPHMKVTENHIVESC